MSVAGNVGYGKTVNIFEVIGCYQIGCGCVDHGVYVACYFAGRQSLRVETHISDFAFQIGITHYIAGICSGIIPGSYKNVGLRIDRIVFCVAVGAGVFKFSVEIKARCAVGSVIYPCHMSPLLCVQGVTPYMSEVVPRAFVEVDVV